VKLPANTRLSARFRTRFTAADGSPGPVRSPVAPRTTSTRSIQIVSDSDSPAWVMLSMIVGMPSNWKLLTMKPRE